MDGGLGEQIAAAGSNQLLAGEIAQRPLPPKCCALNHFDKKENDFALSDFDEHQQCAKTILMLRNKISIFKRQQSRKFYASEVEMERSGWKI